MRTRLFLGSAVAIVAIAASVTPAGTSVNLAPIAEASARVIDRTGSSVGVVLFQQTARGVRIDINLSRLAPGPHAVHIHAVGKCEPGYAFRAAGPHFDVGGHAHGRLAPGGPHTGDFENQMVNKYGFMRATIKDIRSFTLGPGPTTLFDPDGSSIVVHLAPDDYASQPDGKGGERIACGVLKAR